MASSMRIDGPYSAGICGGGGGGIMLPVGISDIEALGHVEVAVEKYFLHMEPVAFTCGCGPNGRHLALVLLVRQSPSCSPGGGSRPRASRAQYVGCGGGCSRGRSLKLRPREDEVQVAGGVVRVSSALARWRWRWRDRASGRPNSTSSRVKRWSCCGGAERPGEYPRGRGSLARRGQAGLVVALDIGLSRGGPKTRNPD